MKLLRNLVLSAVLAISPLALAFEPVDINSADAPRLAEALSGIGASKAEAIIAHRTRHGPFQSVDELLQVKGIGPATIQRNRERLTIGETP